MTKQVLETALQVEMAEHLGYDRHDPLGRLLGNSRNGFTPKVREGTVANRPVYVAMGITIDGYRDILCCGSGPAAAKEPSVYEHADRTAKPTSPAVAVSRRNRCGEAHD